MYILWDIPEDKTQVPYWLYMLHDFGKGTSLIVVDVAKGFAWGIGLLKYFCHSLLVKFFSTYYQNVCFDLILIHSSQHASSLKTKSFHDVNFVLTGVCHYDNLWWGQWWQNWYHDNFQVSMIIMWFEILLRQWLKYHNISHNLQHVPSHVFITLLFLYKLC